MQLTDLVTKLPYISSRYAALLKKLRIETIQDFLTHFPRTYKDSSEIQNISDMLLNPQANEVWQFRAFIKSFKNIILRGGKALQQVVIFDETGEVQIGFFNQSFLKNVFKNGVEVMIRVKPAYKGNKITFYGSDYEILKEGRTDTIHTGRIVPEYSLTAGIAKKWFRNRMNEVVALIKSNEFNIKNELEILIPKEKLKKALENIHFPESEHDFTLAEKLLSLYELSALQLKLHKKRLETKIKMVNIKLDKKRNYLEEFVKTLPFKLTEDQLQILSSITEAIKEGKYINDLVQGDVGSGKTVIAQYIAYLFTLQNLQVVILAPTTVLAEQHFKSFTKVFDNFNVQVELVIGSVKKNNENADIIIGTSAVLARKTKILKNVGILIVDEQQRFGVNQREEILQMLNLKQKPHFLQLTATPIPRTIAETFFGDIKVHTINTKPVGRIPIQTRVVPEEKRENMIDWIKERILRENNQAFWICPLIDGDEKKSVMNVYNEIKKSILPLKIGILHGKMKPKEKLEIMKQFSKNQIHILISTTVIEVGIDIPNATVMIIDNAESFGLAQLHQIRGRVGRSDKESWCFILHETEVSQQVKDRLSFFASNTNGLEIAEYDLKQRGPGEVYGTKQSGIPNLKIAKLSDLDLIKQSKKVAEKLFENGIRKIELFPIEEE